MIFGTNIGEIKITHFLPKYSNVTYTNLHSTASRKICKFGRTNIIPILIATIITMEQRICNIAYSMIYKKSEL